MKSVAARNKKAAEKAKMMELLDSAQPGEVSATVTKTYSQRDITKHADVQTLNKKFDLHLEMGKYHSLKNNVLKINSRKISKYKLQTLLVLKEIFFK